MYDPVLTQNEMIFMLSFTAFFFLSGCYILISLAKSDD